MKEELIGAVALVALPMQKRFDSREDKTILLAQLEST